MTSLLWLPVLFLFYLVYLFNYTLSHEIAEIFSIIIAVGIFMLTWNARNFIDNHYFLFLGIAYLFVGGIDFLHSVSFSGILTNRQNVSIELWFASRFLQGLALLAAPLFATRRIRPGFVFAGFFVTTVGLVGTVYYRIFPDYYIPGKGLMNAKGVSDYLVTGILVLSIGSLWKVRERFDRDVFLLLVLSVLFSIGTELSGVFYTDAFLYNSVFGHFLKVVSFYLVYEAIIATGLLRPYALLFRNLKKSEEEARAARDELESRVAERTAELRDANLRLQGELSERQRAEEMRQLILDLLQLIQSVRNIPEFLSSLSSFLEERIGCEAVGIRYRIGDEYPCLAPRGFPQEFVQAGMSLCPADRSVSVGGGGTGGNDPSFECMCGAVIAGRIDPSLPFFTPYGTFWTDCASDLLAKNEAIKAIATRGRCVRQGYETIALVPLRLGDETLGLLQFYDRRRGILQPHILDRLERVAENIAGPLARLLAQEALEESEGRFRSLVHHSSVGILIVQKGQIVFRSPRQEQLFGAIPEGLPFRELGQVHPEDAPHFERLCAAMDPIDMIGQDTVIRFLLPEGDTGRRVMRWLQCQTQPVTFRGRASLLVDMVDITRVKDLERIVTAREKLAAIGQLAAGIAHQIRNPLTGININVSTLDLLSRQTEGLDQTEKENIRAVVAQVKAASGKISSVIKRIMEFSKPVPPQVDRIDINQVVRKALALSEITDRRRFVEFREHLSPEPLYGHADPALLEQVLLNLVTNALQAMNTVDRPGRITVNTEREGDRAVLRVADTGPGVPEHLREMIFEPFYTTRKDGHGIGLSFCRRIVADHGGRLSVGSAEGGGAEFRVELPLKEERSPV